MKNIVATAAFTATAILSLLLCQCQTQPDETPDNHADGDKAGNGGNGNPNTAWYTGNPDMAIFKISNADELAGLAKLVNDEDSPVDFAGKTIELTNSIDLSARYGAGYDGGYGWTAIGSVDNPFRGTFDGQGNVVRGLHINARTGGGRGLFGYIDGATVKNLGLDNVKITARGNLVGGVVGSADGGSNIIDCYAAGTIHGITAVGGVAGDVIGGKVSGCFFTGTVKGNDEEVGGIVGNIDGVTVANCYSHGDTVSGTGAVGGIVGSDGDKNLTTVANCYSTVSVISSSNHAGGIVGYSYNRILITNCAALNKSVEAAADNAGRVAGYYNTGDGVSALTGNIAFRDIKNNAGGTEWGNIDTDKKDGADITAAEINGDGTLGDRFTAGNGWNTENGKLPGRGAAVGMPEHLRLVRMDKLR